jgi:hypothetical protein
MRRKKTKPNYRKIVLRLPDLDHAKASVLNSLSSPQSRRNYRFTMDQFIAWYCSPRSPVAERSAVCALGAFASREHGPSVTFLNPVRHIRTDPLEASVVACQWLQESGLWQSLRETTALARFHIDVYLLHLWSECMGRSTACNGSTNEVFYLAEFRTPVGNRKHQSFALGTFST